jgi:hypothetical protein
MPGTLGPADVTSPEIVPGTNAAKADGADAKKQKAARVATAKDRMFLKRVSPFLRDHLSRMNPAVVRLAPLASRDSATKPHTTRLIATSLSERR